MIRCTIQLVLIPAPSRYLISPKHGANVVSHTLPLCLKAKFVRAVFAVEWQKKHDSRGELCRQLFSICLLYFREEEFLVLIKPCLFCKLFFVEKRAWNKKKEAGEFAMSEANGLLRG